MSQFIFLPISIIAMNVSERAEIKDAKSIQVFWKSTPIHSHPLPTTPSLVYHPDRLIQNSHSQCSALNPSPLSDGGAPPAVPPFGRRVIRMPSWSSNAGCAERERPPLWSRGTLLFNSAWSPAPLYIDGPRWLSLFLNFLFTSSGCISSLCSLWCSPRGRPAKGDIQPLPAQWPVTYWSAAAGLSLHSSHTHIFWESRAHTHQHTHANRRVEPKGPQAVWTHRRARSGWIAADREQLFTHCVDTVVCLCVFCLCVCRGHQCLSVFS